MNLFRRAVEAMQSDNPSEIQDALEKERRRQDASLGHWAIVDRIAQLEELREKLDSRLQAVGETERVTLQDLKTEILAEIEYYHDILKERL